MASAFLLNTDQDLQWSMRSTFSTVLENLAVFATGALAWMWIRVVSRCGYKGALGLTSGTADADFLFLGGILTVQSAVRGPLPVAFDMPQFNAVLKHHICNALQSLDTIIYIKETILHMFV